MIAGARLELGAPPRNDMLDHTRPYQDRQQAGPHQRGLADPAHAGDHEKAVSHRGASLQHVEQFGDETGAAAIDQRMLEVEGLEPTERRAFPLRLRGIEHLGGLEPLADPVPHVDFEQVFELDGFLEVVEGGLESAVGVAEPLVDELAHRIELGHLLRALLAVLHRQPDLGRLQVAENLWSIAALMRVPGTLEFVFGAGGVLAAIGAAELIERQWRAHPGPENKKREVGLGDVDDLGLKGVGRAQQAALPQIGFELDLAAELELQPLGDRERDAALGPHVPRRRYKYA